MTGKPKIVEIPDDLRASLEDFCEANLGAPASRVIVQATREYIQRRLSAEPELKRLYDEARAVRLGDSRKLKLVEGSGG